MGNALALPGGETNVNCQLGPETPSCGNVRTLHPNGATATAAIEIHCR